jgi:hypothetical protein
VAPTAAHLGVFNIDHDDLTLAGDRAEGARSLKIVPAKA